MTTQAPLSAQASDVAIELRMRRIDDLFDPLDPFPTPTRDLSPSAERFIIDWARDLPPKARLSLTIYCASEDGDSGGVQEAVRRHFTYLAERATRDLHELMATGRIALLIGLAVLGACVALHQLAQAILPKGGMALFVTEGLIILGWVANWRPMEIFLYEWWPIVRRRRLMRRLADMKVEFRRD